LSIFVLRATNTDGVAAPGCGLSIRFQSAPPTDYPFDSGGGGAYAIHVNNGARATGYTTAMILNNTISNLVGGGWTHAIGLEGNTPNVLVKDNSISNLVAPTIDSVAVWFEDNPSFSTGRVNYNNLDVTIADYGIAVHPPLSGRPVDGTCNWWGDPNGPGRLVQA